MDNEKNPTPPAESTSGGEKGGDGKSPASDSPATQPNVDELLDAARGEVKARPASTTPRTPVTPSARAASSNTRAEAAPTGDTPDKATPAATPPAARAAPDTGASKTTSTPTPEINKGVSKGVAAKVPAATAKSAAAGATTAKPAGAVAARPAGAAAAAKSGATTVNAAPAPDGDEAIFKMRRRIIWASVAGFLAASFLMFLRFFLPRSITEPSNVVRLGFPGDYNFGVDTKWQQQYRIWVVKNSERLFVINAVCTHLGCTPDWKESENKFKCPCHGSGYDSEGINFEGPAPRPMDRAYVELDAEGQIVADKGRLYMWPKGAKNQFNDEGSYIRIA